MLGFHLDHAIERRIKMKTPLSFTSAIILCAGTVFLAGCNNAGKSITAEVHRTTASGSGEAIGKVTFRDTRDGLEIRTDLKGLPAGPHGFHIHERGSCEPAEKDGAMSAAEAAGGHYDPDKTGKHLGPEGGGHKGDLPVLMVEADGTAKTTMNIKGVKAEAFENRALMIHEGGDNYSDVPVELGGGGKRIACGIIR